MNLKSAWPVCGHVWPCCMCAATCLACHGGSFSFFPVLSIALPFPAKNSILSFPATAAPIYSHFNYFLEKKEEKERKPPSLPRQPIYTTSSPEEESFNESGEGGGGSDEEGMAV